MSCFLSKHFQVCVGPVLFGWCLPSPFEFPVCHWLALLLHSACTGLALSLHVLVQVLVYQGAFVIDVELVLVLLALLLLELSQLHLNSASCT